MTTTTIEAAPVARTPEQRARDFLAPANLLQGFIQARLDEHPLSVDVPTLAAFLLRNCPESYRTEIGPALRAALPEALDALVLTGSVTRTAAPRTDPDEAVTVLYDLDPRLVDRVVETGLQVVLSPPPPPAPPATLDEARRALVCQMLVATIGREVRWLDSGDVSRGINIGPLLAVLLGQAPAPEALSAAHDDLRAAGMLDETTSTPYRPRLAPALWHFVRMMAALDPI